MSLKYTVLCLGIFLSALQVQAQVASEGEPEKKGEMFREVPNPEKMAQKETDRLKEALNLTDKQYKKVYKLILKEQRELLENRMQRPPMMDGAPKPESAEDMQKRIAKKNKKMKKILTETQYDQWLGMSQKPMPKHKPEGTPKQERDDE